MLYGLIFSTLAPAAIVAGFVAYSEAFILS